jgi:hypothetical protein
MLEDYVLEDEHNNSTIKWLSCTLDSTKLYESYSKLCKNAKSCCTISKGGSNRDRFSHLPWHKSNISLFNHSSSNFQVSHRCTILCFQGKAWNLQDGKASSS